jgi:hypothetical protein
MKYFILEKSTGRKRKACQSICEQCNKEYLVDNRRKGKQKYCSLKCRNVGLKRRKIYICSYCGNSFDSVFRETKHGYRFCTRYCKDKAQKIGGIKEIQPTHYGTGTGINYRKSYIEELSWKCVDCRISNIAFLDVHHIDGNRSNNDFSNLEVVCPNHHSLRHIRLTGKNWVYDSKSLTPRECLVKLIGEINNV